ncbi:uncharacterized protein TRIVIDRAFT_151548 [Trichoderma virens Gv29-8]|uniref:Zn(2)-C6 fungal-type domain-containing protein n=1 Tax=Hypocrea virens (strain Gv29-8 / FGSC 10586) TaxID=413071 RepID=G9MUG0_HYPVG|nr:uncharacterized protein TRIVIDRAFT_151548 [Trichoderma virens Gv29-8]EHK21930.1 hypothetical protein TRIVIDRAFT_151548 [Trichoderma virens Gv29-8]UKZ54373.1 hypothetical protein TrVGV298_008181 [Trichoderma virens]
MRNSCEPCRDRKSRCDGGTPICSGCQRRGLALDLCVYKVDNARTASNEAYIRALHERIRSLENACKGSSISAHPFGSDERDDRPANSTGAADQREDANGALSPVTTRSSCQDSTHLPLDMLPLAPADHIDSSDDSNPVTAMGTISATDDHVNSALKGTNEFYGSSSAAFFIKETYGSMGTATAGLRGMPPRSGFEGGQSANLLSATHTFHFSLPPRFVADQLLDEFWRRVYYLYPMFHRPTFESAYHSLWEAHRETDSTAPASSGELGLGGSPGAGPGSIVFHCALNTIFALGCSFLDAPASEKSNAIQVYFLRAKHFIGLDFLDMNNIGVVQSLLLMTLFLQSTSFASRCWNAVGIACRVAQGLGLHAEPDVASRSPLEREIRRRTWHCCLVLDRLVSMTFGRPTMTAHLSNLELPSSMDYDSSNGEDGIGGNQNAEVSRYLFNVEHIRLCNILGEILFQVFQPSDGPLSAKQSNGRPNEGHHGLDVILNLDAQLSEYVKTVHPALSWVYPRAVTSVKPEIKSVLEMQRNALHVRFLYFRLMLHRPTLTNVCITSGVEELDSSLPYDARQTLYKSCAIESAKICIQSAMQLLEAMARTCATSTSTGWWWTGLYTSTAGLVLLIGRSNPLLEASMGRQAMEQSWRACQAILNELSSSSPSAQRSIKLLQALNAKLTSRTERGHAVPLEADRTEKQHAIPTGIQPDRCAARVHVATEPEAQNNQFATGWHPPGCVLPGLQADKVPNFDMEDSFVNWDQAMDFMTDAPGFL